MSKQKNLNPVQNLPQQRNNRNLIEFKNQFLSPIKKSEPFHSFSQPKTRSNIIKINKGKLPADFFPKCLSFQKKLPHFKLNLKEQDKQFIQPKNRKAQSQRLHISPQKTSFFGFFENDQFDIQDLGTSSKKLSIKRKFETRQQPKRENLEMKRRFTPGSNSHRSDLLDLFPATYDQQMTQIVISNSSARVGKFSPRKQYITKYQQQVHDPQKSDQKHKTIVDEVKYQTSTPTKNVITLKTIQKISMTEKLAEKNRFDKLDYTFAGSQTVDLHNMTFFNAKSSCLPPIKKI